MRTWAGLLHRHNSWAGQAQNVVVISWLGMMLLTAHKNSGEQAILATSVSGDRHYASHRAETRPMQQQVFEQEKHCPFSSLQSLSFWAPFF